MSVASPPDNGGNSPPPADGSTLDTTLLESLFYNEMMMLDDSSDLLSSITGAASGETYGNAAAPPPGKQATTPRRESSGGASSTATAAGKEESTEDPLTFVEQSLLRDFGVTGSPIPHISDDSSENKAGKPQDQPPHPHAQAQAQDQPPQQPWNNGQHASYYPQQNQDPNRYPPQPHYPNHHHHPGQPYPPNAHYPPTHQPHHQNYQHPPQPRPPQAQVSKGIKHSVMPRQTPSPGKHQQSASNVNHTPQQQSSIPNPLARHHPSQPPAHPNPHQQQPPPHYDPNPQSHPAHQQPQPPHHHQPHYHHLHTQPPGAGPTPSLVPVPAPGPAHHPQSAFGPQPPVAAGHASPPYNTSHVAPHAVMPVAGHPPPPHGHAHLRPHHPTHMHQYPPTHPPKDQLVSQFATLANRLGINLPPHLLSSLTESAGIVSAEASSSAALPPHYASAHGVPPPPLSKATTSQGSNGSSSRAPQRGNCVKHSAASGDMCSTANGPTPLTSSSSTAIDANTPVAEALRRTAEEAIAAVTRKRSHGEAGLSKRNSTTSVQCGESSESKAAAAFAKKRKKPRMEDCESRLAQLRAENEKLKRHLDNVTNQTNKFEQDRINAEETMKTMLDNNDVPDEELDAVIHEYSEAYSDYGRRRHEELSFHLEQLQKLANPTNFTKMGLWTIAKANDSKDMSKQNPLVGILQKELNIAPQQVRKILEQREKIRELCNNLNASLLLLQKLQELCEEKNKKFNDRMSRTREILSPKQVVKLIMWIKEHSHVLGNICPGWTSEQIVKKRHKAPAPAPTSTVATTATTTTGRVEDAKPSASIPPASETNQD